MDTKRPLSLFLVAILAASVFTLVGISSLPAQNAGAQEVTIRTSADNLGGTFYGESFLQVVITDPDAADDDAAQTLSVTVDIDGDEGTFDITETSDTSGKFEFFLVHEDSDLDEGALDGIDAVPFIVIFGPDGAPSGGILESETIVATVTMGDDVATINIEASGVDVDIDYDQDAGVLELDREEYGSTSLVHVFITDQDANNDPTNADEFTVAAADLDGATFDDLFDVFGATLPDAVTFTETGDNTAKFEAILLLADAASGDDDELVFDADTISIELHDHADYGDITDADGDVDEDSDNISEVSLVIDDSDGEVDPIGDLAFGGELKVLVTDNDQNRDSTDADPIDDALAVVVDAVGGDVETVSLTETEDNSNEFEIDLSNAELKITFLSDGADPTAENDILELRAEDIDGDITITYTDPLNGASAAAVVAVFVVGMDLTPGSLSAPAEAGVTESFTVTLTDPDLNDNPRIRDAYEWELTGASPFSLTRAGLDYSEVYTLEIELEGAAVDFGVVDVSTTMRETGPDTGIFEFDISMDDISDFGDGGAALAAGDGDDLDVTINDFMADVDEAEDDDVTITITKPATGLDFSRSVVPPPPEAGSARLDAGDTVVVTMIVTDPILNTETNIEEEYAFVIGDGANEFLIEVEGADGLEDCELDGTAALDALDECDLGGGVDLDDVLDVGDLVESSQNSGVFEVDLEFTAAGTESGEWQDMEITFTYEDDDGDTETAGFTFRGNDGILTVDAQSAKTGTDITITVEDQDLNLDDGEIDEFDSGDAFDLLIVETEDDDVGGITDATFEETDEDSGVFQATFTVGDDIPVTDVAAGLQASNILVTYDDDLDSAGGGGEVIEANVPVVSSTGSIQVTPELVGPVTTLTILIIDADLDADAGEVDELTEADLDGAVEFSSSRNEVGEAGPDIEETGPNTGVFMFELELITDAEACADDDLDAAEFAATGGDTSSTIGACPGDLIAIKYVDAVTASGRSNTESVVIEVMSWDPEFVADKDSYSTNDRVTITITDPDANRDAGIADTISDIRVTSDSDRVGEEFSALETGKDTGVFTLSFSTTSGTAGGAISVNTGDTVTVTYTDEFPADFAENQEDEDFDFTVQVGGLTGPETTEPSPPSLKDISGNEIDEVGVGQQVVLSTTIQNNNDEPQPFVALIEVRDSDGITVFLAWQTGTLNANGEAEVGLSWTPEEAGDYTVRTFVISELAAPDILSPVAESETTVS
jgi:hypothetical protein